MNANAVRRLLDELGVRAADDGAAGPGTAARPATAPMIHNQVTINVHGGTTLINTSHASCCARHEAASEAPPGHRPRPAGAEPADA